MKRLPVIGFETSYEVSESGRVYSLARIVVGRDETKYPFPAMEKALTLNKQTGYLQVDLYHQNTSYKKAVHRVVGKAFLVKPKNKHVINHLDGDKQNNHSSNLEWTDFAGNSQHAVDTGLRVYSNRLTEAEFIQCLQAVIEGESYASLSGRVPYKVPFLSTKVRKLARKTGLEELLDNSLMLQRQRRARINGAKNN